MISMVLNDQSAHAFEISSFSRTTSFNAEGANSYGYVGVIPSPSTVAFLQTIGVSGINSIELKNENGESIYTLADIEATIQNIDENLNGDNMSVNMNLNFVI